MMNEQKRLEHLHEFLMLAFEGNADLQPVLTAECVEIYNDKQGLDFSVYPTEVTQIQKSFGGKETFLKVQRWAVETYEHIPQTREMPEDYNTIDLGNFEMPYNVAFCILSEAAKYQIENKLQSVNYKIAEQSGQAADEYVPF